MADPKKKAIETKTIKIVKVKKLKPVKKIYRESDDEDVWAEATFGRLGK